MTILGSNLTNNMLTLSKSVLLRENDFEQVPSFGALECPH